MLEIMEWIVLLEWLALGIYSWAKERGRSRRLDKLIADMEADLRRSVDREAGA